MKSGSRYQAGQSAISGIRSLPELYRLHQFPPKEAKKEMKRSEWRRDSERMTFCLTAKKVTFDEETLHYGTIRYQRACVLRRGPNRNYSISDYCARCRLVPRWYDVYYDKVHLHCDHFRLVALRHVFYRDAFLVSLHFTNRCHVMSATSFSFPFLWVPLDVSRSALKNNTEHEQAELVRYPVPSFVLHDRQRSTNTRIGMDYWSLVLFSLCLTCCGAEESVKSTGKYDEKEASFQSYTISNLVTFRSPNSSKEAQPLGHLKIDLDIVPLSEFSKGEKTSLQYFHLHVDDTTNEAPYKARNLTGYPYLVQLDIDDALKKIVPTFYFDKRENPISRNFKRELSNFVIALKGRQRDKDKKAEPTQINPNPIERRTFGTSIVSGLDDKPEEDRSYHNLTLSTKLSTPWTGTPLHEVDHMIFVVQSLEAIEEEYDNVTSLQQPSIDDTVAMFPQLRMEDEGLPTFDLLESQRRLVAPEKTTPLSNVLKRVRKYTMKSKAASRKAGQVFLVLHGSAERSTKEELVAALTDSLSLKKKQVSST
ncbi:hypothetical protein RvY_17140-2 [Ramazzottius varieornatus]|uniref:Uncharacterized protein n=1 Tax=Ramazzottius varieornatus TaxID=947166 RepID=A0A1D1W3F4_RAMVA|nr:hypothetical protein RvY_17140-2 [Ramazzottius varieornatus]